MFLRAFRAAGACWRRFFLGAFHVWILVLLGEGDSHFYVSKARWRRAVSGAHGLHGLAFAAVGRAPKCPIIARADSVATIPEFGGDAAVAGILDHAAFLAALYLPADFGGKLKMIAAVVDGPGTIGVHQDGVVGVGNQVVIFPGAGIDADVGHADDGQAVPVFCPHGSIGTGLADGGGSLAIA